MDANWLDLAKFCGLLALGQFSPGPDMVLLTQTGLRHGRAAGWWAAAGITTGLTLHATVSLCGLQWVARRHPSAWLGLQTVAGLYLLWLAALLWKHRHPPVDGAPPPPPPAGGFYRLGLFCNLLNPKVLLFFGALVTPFLVGDRPVWWPWALWTMIVVEGLVLWGLWVAVLQHPVGRRAYARAGLGINVLFALLMTLLALKLLWEALARLTAGSSGG